MKKLKSLAQYIACLVAGVALGYGALQVPRLLRPLAISGDYSAYYVGAPAKVVLYSTQSCPFCAQTRAFFSERHVPYVERDVQTDPGALAQWKQLGASGVPQVLIGDRRIPGYAPQALEDALARLKERGG